MVEKRISSICGWQEERLFSYYGIFLPNKTNLIWGIQSDTNSFKTRLKNYAIPNMTGRTSDCSAHTRLNILLLDLNYTRSRQKKRTMKKQKSSRSTSGTPPKLSPVRTVFWLEMKQLLLSRKAEEEVPFETNRVSHQGDDITGVRPAVCLKRETVVQVEK